ncbi:glycosyltransferase [Escherichia coli]|nr:glycosyltransferase [Escherichia coli]ELM0382724.1 glycosyltransferase [Escherichia coli]EME2610936.1 glycosyltransferase [Escherichia coli]HAJ7495153.1 glycosyltransferase [Escherichia coli]HAJ7500255.1 glycosyltransferase [Escherichia coli]
MRPLITVITVVYNDRQGLLKTINSLEKQTNLSNLEYIVVDGNSNDSTTEIIINSKVITKYIIETDNGIYDAMNKGIDLATGEWLLFLNAGDVLYHQDVLSKLNYVINNISEGVNFIYSDYVSGNIYYKQSMNLNFLVSHMINHQNIVYRYELLKQRKYNTRYRFCADYKHLLDNYELINPHKTNFIISLFDDTGISSQSSNKYIMWVERLAAVWSSSLSWPKKIKLSKRGVLALPYQFLKTMILKMRIL